MDLGIKGRTAVVCASSRGLGYACAKHLAEAGCTVVINGRDGARLDAAAARLREETGAEIVGVTADLADPAGRDELLAAVPQVDILVNNNGGPPSRDFRQIDHEGLLKGVEGNMLVPIALVQAVIDGMMERRFGRIVNITSGSVKAPLPGLDLSSGARAGLTGFLAGVARQVAHANVTINFLLPGAFDTDRLTSLMTTAAEKSGKDLDTIRAERAGKVPSARIGVPDEFGAACAFLCSTHAGYIVGQSLLIDGGAFPGVL
ncbi:SDR family oxidoreductase [Aurantimonas sp. MSK8Z-1]|uniref:SDR family oxidoreductase n=1 Tax=Mangrovibrevibacter kandeliae TaxID=2968473 RepID=UPI00211862C2|nr:SDR family oxidoreductase [Aurantimonas sp. MSK8Z-1]MCW4116081.1 SDR family oxidoreductase [Aurantimonas sp. MSK8Z-1]